MKNLSLTPKPLLPKPREKDKKLKLSMNNCVSNMMKPEKPLLNVLLLLKDYKMEEALLKSKELKLTSED